jgi:crotonobetainyl-CoA:carnitine CoA-transferase CaiB-like acyl-CoA transferase
VTTYTTKDDKFLSFSCLQAAKYWPELCEIVGRPELATDERFADAEAIRENAGVATDLLRAVFAERTADEWREQLAEFSGQWVLVQDTLEAVSDPQTVANGYVAECETAEGAPYQLATAPVQYDGVSAQPARAPEFNEHGDAILTDLGIDWDTIIDLKVKGVVA